MKKILILINLLLALPILAQAQNGGWQIPPGANTPRAANTPGTPMNRANIDIWGNQLVGLQSGTAAVTNPIKLEDTAQTSGDAGIPALGIRNEGGTTVADSNLDYSFIGLNRFGGIFAEISSDKQFAGNSTGLLKPEDSVSASADAGVAVFGVLRSALVAPAAASDYSFLQQDESGRLITTMSPAAETWQGCGTATASTADVAIKAAVASNRIYVSSVTCSSSDADNATNLNFKDGTTVIAVGGVSQMATASDGSFTATFPVPLRGTSNTAFNFNTAVSTSSVICCATGYISVN